MNTCLRILGALTLVLLSGHAAAIPTLKKVKPTFFQSRQQHAQCGADRRGETDLLVLVLAGGFTITCSISSLQHERRGPSTFSDFFGPDASPAHTVGGPSTYGIPGWSSIPAGTCGGQCVMQYKGEAKDETSLSVRIGSDRRGRELRAHPRGAAVVRQLRARQHLPIRPAAVLYAGLRHSMTERKGLL